MAVFRPGVSLVLGGARSGKSAFAERLTDESQLKKIYLATSQAFDGEMESRILEHKQRRGREWSLVEEPLALVDALAQVGHGANCVLVDCLTLWLTNLMMADKPVEPEFDRLIEALNGMRRSNIIFVSNEVGQGIVPMEKLSRDFRDHAGRLHQRLAAQADHVWFVTAGLPQKLK